MKKFTLLKSLFVIFTLSLFSFSAFSAEAIISNVFTEMTMQKSVNNYTSTWDNISQTTLTLVNFNNNNEDWTYVKCGRKDTPSVGTITTSVSLAQVITKVVVTIDAATVAKVDSTYLEVASDSEFKQNVQKIVVDIQKGNIVYTVPTPTANCFYRLTYDCLSGSSNGIVQISKVDFYYDEGDAGDDEVVKPAVPEFVPEDGKVFSGNFIEPFKLTLTAEAGATIKYILGEGAETTFTEPIEIAATTVVKAWAVKDEVESDPVTVTYTFVEVTGKGTEENPFTCADLKALNNTFTTGKYWVRGYVLGTAKSGSSLDDTGYKNSNLAIGDVAGATEFIPVELPNGSDVRSALNLVDNPDLLGKEVMVYGKLESYFSTTGVKNVTDFVRLFAPAKPTITHVESEKSIDVTLACEADAEIYYTIISSKEEEREIAIVDLTSEYDGVITLTGENETKTVYAIAKRAGLYSEIVVSQAYQFKVDGAVAAENVVMPEVYTIGGMVVVDGECEIFTVTGQNVTAMNGSLNAGVYVVRTANIACKVVIKL